MKTFISLIIYLVGLNISLFSSVMADNLQEAKQAIVNKEYSTAIIHLKNQLKETPKNAQARFLLGDVYFRTRKLDSSIKELGRAYEYDPNNTDILFRYIEALLNTEKYKKIINLLNTSFNDRQAESQRLSYIGYAHLGLKQLSDAKRVFNEANQKKESSMAYNGLATLAITEQSLVLANKLVSKSLTLEADNRSSIQLKAKLYNLNERHKEALKLYNQLIEQDPNKISLYLERAATLVILQKNKQAKADIKVVLDNVKNHPQAYFILAQISLRDQDFFGAQASALKVVNTVHQHFPAILILGVSHFGLKQYNQAEEYLSKYLAYNSSDLTAQNLMANVYLAQSQTKQALLTLESIPLELLNKDPMLLLSLGSAYIANNETKKGIDIFYQAQILAPNNLDIKKRLVAAQLQYGELDDAITELEQMSDYENAKSQSDYLLIFSYIKQRYLDKADNKINQLLIQTPHDTKLQNLQALLEQLKGNTNKAINQYQSIIKQDKDNIPAYMGLARIAAIESNWPKAETYFKKVIQINSNFMKAYQGLIAVAEIQDKSLLVEQYFLQAIKKNKENIPTQISIAMMLSQWYKTKQQPEKVLLLAEQLDKQHPNNKIFRSFLSSAQLLNNQKQKAEQTLKMITTFDKNDVKHRLILAQLILQNPERTEEVLSLLRNIQAIAPDNITSYTIEATLLIQKYRYKEALEIVKKIQSQFTSSITGKLLEADIYRAQKDYEKALPIYQQIYKEHQNKNVLLVTVDMLLALDQQDKAKTLLTEAVNKNPQNTNILFKLASLYHEKQQLNQAEQLYEQILNHTPNHTATLNNLAWIVLESDTKKAIELAKRAYEQTPKTSAIADTYGYFLVQDKQYKKGLRLLEKAANDAPQDNDIQYHLALAYEKTNQRNKAQMILKEIVNSKVTFSEQKNAKQLLKVIK